MRVSSGGLFVRLNQSITASAERYGNASDALATGRRVNKASDSPADAGAMLRLSSLQSANAAYARTSVDASSWLAVADAALSDAVDVMGRINDLALSSVNGARGLEDLTAYADEVKALFGQMEGIVNTTYVGTSVFAGYSDKAVQTAAGAATWIGDSGPVLRQIDQDTVVDVATDGQVAFGFAAGDDVFTVINDLEQAIRAGNSTAITAVVDRIHARQSDMLTSLQSVGTRTNLVEATAARLETTSLSVDRSKSALADVDLAKATLDLQAAQTAYKAALAAAGQSNMPSLVDFLR